jgi:hypothetical protein
MRIHFRVGQARAEFRYNALTGRADLQLGQRTVQLQSPLKFSTHFQLGKVKSWTAQDQGHEVTIVKRRPRLVGGLRNNSFTVSVDGTVVAETSGR